MKKILPILTVIFVSFFVFLSQNHLNSIITPITGNYHIKQTQTEFSQATLNFPEFYPFFEEVTKTESVSSDELVGIFAPGNFEFKIIQQPLNHPEYVSEQEDSLTEFSLAKSETSTGLLAHNYLAGKHFSNLEIEDLLITISADKTISVYQITEISSYQALQPENPYSYFKDTNNPTQLLTSTALFKEIYRDSQTLVLQTCIAQDGQPSWGRLFIKAVLVENTNLSKLLSQKTYN
jgi:hypothetical protein